MHGSEYTQHDGLGLAALVAEGEVTPVELLTAARARMEEVDPRLNAVVRSLDEHADARAAGDLAGSFAGVPFLLKELNQPLAGTPSSGASRALTRVPAAETATVVQRWLDAGLVVFGRTNTPEFGAKAVTEPELFGPCRNPWALDRTPGGSSGGAGAAVAAGIVPVAGASDGGGSIRIPAACCGLFGLKPSRGLLPSGPGFGEHALGAATNGVISRSVRDTGAMLDVLKGPDRYAPYLGHVPDGRLLDEVGRDPGRLRIGFTSASRIGEPHPEAVTAVEDAAALLADLGHDVEPVEPPYDDERLAREFLTTWFTAMALSVDHAKELSGAGDEGFERDTLLLAVLGRAASPVDVLAAIEARHVHARALAEFHERFDLLLTPSLAQPPLPVGSLAAPPAVRLVTEGLLRSRTAGLVLPRLPVVDGLIRANLGWVPYTQLANVTGRPAASVPLHWTADGLPLGVQLVAPLGGEGLLLRLAGRLEEARPWADRRPPL
jgi:amidase